MKTITLIAAMALFAGTAVAQSSTPADSTRTAETSRRAAHARSAETATTTETASETASETDAVVEGSAPSGQLRGDFMRILAQNPPEVGQVLKLDPTLLNNQGYLATYPELARFVHDHPSIAHSPAYFLEDVDGMRSVPPESESMRMWRSLMESISIMVVMMFIFYALTWLIRTVIDHRRWSRLSKVQSEVHTKLLDRFSSNEELFAYIQTPPGRRFLESAPIQLDAGSPRQVSAPLGRILWSVQAGVVLAAAGIGFQTVSGHVKGDVASPLSAVGVLALAVGIGFVISSLISYVISRRLGLLDTAAAAAE